MDHNCCIPGDRDASEQVTSMDHNYCIPGNKDSSDRLDQTGLDIVSEVGEDHVLLTLPENRREVRKQGVMSSTIDGIMQHPEMSGLGIKFEPTNEDLIIPMKLENEVKIEEDTKLKEFYNSLQHQGGFKMKGEAINEEFVSDGHFEKHGSPSDSQSLATSTQEASHKCVICRKFFEHNIQLSMHMRIHTGEFGQNSIFCGNGLTAGDPNLCSGTDTPNSLDNNSVTDEPGNHVVWRTYIHTKGFMTHTGKVTHKDDMLCENRFIETSYLPEQLSPDVCVQGLDYNNDISNQVPINWERCYKCDRCGKEYGTQPTLRRHLEIHTVNQSVRTVRSVENEAIDKSIVCSKQNEEEAMSELNNYQNPCNFCDKGFQSTFALHLHLLTHFKGRPQDCDACVQGFTSEELLLNHLINHIESSMYDSCPYVIGVQKKKQSVLSDNSKCFTARTHSSKQFYHTGTAEGPSNEQPHKRDVWLKGINTEHNISEFMLNHMGERPHKCDVCGKGFTQKGNLTTHMLTHTGERPHKCSVCWKTFTQKGNLATHVLIHIGERPYKCSVCGQGYIRKCDLTTHMFTHTGERPHKCDVCGKGFTYKGHLTGHMLTHTGERPHKCGVCGKGFTHKGHLSEHMFTHTGERPHKCRVCGKGFRHKGNLSEHMLTHTGERPHKCGVCGKGFRHKGTLPKHMLTHTGERPHKCSLCGKSFKQKMHLTKHMFTHTGEYPHKCGMCGRGFIQKSFLTEHMLTHGRVRVKNVVRV